MNASSYETVEGGTGTKTVFSKSQVKRAGHRVHDSSSKYGENIILFAEMEPSYSLSMSTESVVYRSSTPVRRMWKSFGALNSAPMKNTVPGSQKMTLCGIRLVYLY
jgi:hypothetical protein